MPFRKLILVKKGVIIDKFALTENEFIELIIGRGSECDIQVNEESVSKKHICITQSTSNEVKITDLNSTNGTYINEKKIASNIAISVNDGDIISLGQDAQIQLIIEGVEKILKGKFPISENKIITIGRNSNCNIVLDNNLVSGCHCEIEKKGIKYFIKDNKSTNGTYVNDILVSGVIELVETDIIKVGDFSFKLIDILERKKILNINHQKISPINLLKKKNSVLIGRDLSVDIVIADNVISRKHARITVEDGIFFIEDLKSTNGTFVNDKLITKKTKISESDEIRIGLSIISLLDGEQNINNTIAIKARGISKKYTNGYIGLQSMNVDIPTRSFVALMGPSGCGKTTLLNILNGANPSTTGNVTIHGLDLKNYYGLIKQKIGYVPQDDIVHKELIVNESLYYAAKLRMNEDTTDAEIELRINQVLTSLNINDADVRSNRIKELSGGQRKRISIAVELLNHPAILFLDEPTSPLDPETIDDFLKTLKGLSKSEGTTIVMVTHKPEDLNFVDKVLFLANKGHIAYYGNVREVYNYFKVENRSINSIYSLLSDSKRAEELYLKWQKTEIKKNDIPFVESRDSKTYNYSSFRQYYWLTRRYLRIKLSDKLNLTLLFAQPIIIALLLSLIFDNFQIGVIFLMSISAIWFGVSNSAKEIVDEVPIYQRERMFNLKILPYLFSKITILSAIAFIQVSIFVLIISIRYSSMNVNISNEIYYILLMFFLSLSATLLGLLLSAMFKTAEKVMTVVPIALLPQIMLSGVITNLNTGFKDFISYFTLGRWGTEALSRIQNLNINYQNISEKTFYITKPNQQGRIIDTTYVKEEVIRSVMKLMPQFNTAKDTLVYNPTTKSIVPYQYKIGTYPVKGNPMELLDFYNGHTFGVFNSLSLNVFIISVISVITFMAIIYLLHTKDSIKIN